MIARIVSMLRGRSRSPREVPVERAAGTVRLAGEYIEAARGMVLGDDESSFVVYFLLGHALELGCKAVLTAHGTTEEALRRLGHDLVAIVRAAEQLLPSGALGIDSPARDRIRLIAPFYRARGSNTSNRAFAGSRGSRTCWRTPGRSSSASG